MAWRLGGPVLPAQREQGGNRMQSGFQPFQRQAIGFNADHAGVQPAAASGRSATRESNGTLAAVSTKAPLRLALRTRPSVHTPSVVAISAGASSS